MKEESKRRNRCFIFWLINLLDILQLVDYEPPQRKSLIFSPRSGSGREERLARSDAGSGVEMDEEEYETIDKVGEEKLIN